MTERRTDATSDATSHAASERRTDAGPPRHFPAFPAWRTFGAGWLADRLFRRHEDPPTHDDGSSD